MPKLPLLTAKKLITKIEAIGFVFVRQKGSHAFYRHADGRTTLIPIHPGEMIDRGLVLKIIKQDLEISRDEFLKI